jgi:hypothetical protein
MKTRPRTYDLSITKEVRTKALGDILEVLNETKESKKWGEYKKQMLLKLATTVLPRVNEHTGADGERLFPAPILSSIFDKNGNVVHTNNSNKENSEPNKEN